MGRRIGVIATLVCVTAAWFAAYGADDSEAAKAAWKKADGFVAHEWGAQVFDARHPYSMADDLAGTPAQTRQGVVEEAMGATGKPVLFLYTDKELTLNVTADMQDGCFKYYFPPALLSRPYQGDEGPASGYRRLRWLDLRVLPVGKEGDVKLQDAPKGHWWHDCRAVASSRVQISYERWQKELAPLPQAEQFLFYDGLSKTPAAATGFSVEKDAIKIECRSEAELRDVFVIERAKGALRWGYAAKAQNGQSVELQYHEDVAAEFMRCMLRAGLYEDEARAFWAAWGKQFSLNDGARVIYRLPQEEMDKLLPLTIEPKPDVVVRVNWVCLGI